MSDAPDVSDLYLREGERLLLFLTRRTWDPEIALEITAETFATAIESWQKLAGRSPEEQRAWLFTVARRLHNRYAHRARVERRALARLGMQVPGVGADEASEIIRRAGLEEIRDILTVELKRLSTVQREALRLRILEERSYQEIAVLLGVSEQTARARVSRALRRLADSLEGAGSVRGPHIGGHAPATQEGGS